MFNINRAITYVLSPSSITQRMERTGDVLQYLLPLASLVAVAIVGDSLLARAWIYAVLCQVIIIEGLKITINYTTLGIRPNGDINSFPSRYVAGSFFGATFITMVWGIWWGIIPLLLATFVGYTRVISHNHWIRDTVASAIISTMCTYGAVYHLI